jgi:hypothetical protein
LSLKPFEMRNQLKIISGFAALTASVAGVCLEAVYTPPSPQKWALVFGISAVAGLRLYLYSEGSALVEISPKDARRAFALSVILSLALIAYGFLIKFARGRGRRGVSGLRLFPFPSTYKLQSPLRNGYLAAAWAPPPASLSTACKASEKTPWRLPFGTGKSTAPPWID